jgi:hypothetical protein
MNSDSNLLDYMYTTCPPPVKRAESAGPVNAPPSVRERTPKVGEVIVGAAPTAAAAPAPVPTPPPTPLVATRRTQRRLPVTVPLRGDPRLNHTGIARTVRGDSMGES